MTAAPATQKWQNPGFTAPLPTVVAPGVPRFPAMKAAEIEDPWRRISYDGSFVMEEKFDGFRAGLTYNPDGTIVIRNVYGEDKGRIENAPHIKSELVDISLRADNELFDGTLIDGELVGMTLEETGHLLGASGKTDPRLRFRAFDLPFLAGTDLRGQPWSLRRNLLVSLLGDAGGPISIVDVMDPAPELVQAIWDRGGEGAIIKPVDAPYVPAGRGHWVKIKEHHTADAVVFGYELGKGKYAGKVGALRLAQYKGGRFTEVCKVSGMTDAERDDMSLHMSSWLNTVVEFEYQRKTDTGSYRHPRFVRRRLDKRREDCTWEASP